MYNVQENFLAWNDGDSGIGVPHEKAKTHLIHQNMSGALDANVNKQQLKPTHEYFFY